MIIPSRATCVFIAMKFGASQTTCSLTTFTSSAPESCLLTERLPDVLTTDGKEITLPSNIIMVMSNGCGFQGYSLIRAPADPCDPHDLERFPIQEFGMNYQSQPLQRHEREEMAADPSVISRVMTSYKLMLNFYGMTLVDEQTGLLRRVEPPKRYDERYRNLKRTFPFLCLCNAVANTPSYRRCAQ
jgi:hypothetical protein